MFEKRMNSKRTLFEKELCLVDGEIAEVFCMKRHLTRNNKK
jgi:hypothetical protein